MNGRLVSHVLEYMDYTHTTLHTTVYGDPSGTGFWQ
jgi:hypothetical protein